jgi:diamine N-acetyltransferase
MKLRNLETRDANKMLEWMHDISVVEKLHTDFSSKTIDDCYGFIRNSISETDIHLAISDDNDEYIGTVSLKHIYDRTAEFAITICKDAMGKGVSIWAMREMLKIGFEKYGLTDIYWCVAADNFRALKFYDKNRFSRIESDKIKDVQGYTRELIDKYVWYRVTNKQFDW